MTELLHDLLPATASAAIVYASMACAEFVAIGRRRLTSIAPEVWATRRALQGAPDVATCRDDAQRNFTGTLSGPFMMNEGVYGTSSGNTASVMFG